MGSGWGATDAGRVPLFDRLIDDEPQRKHEPVPYRTLDKEALRASVRRELSRLLSTRCTVPGDVALSRPRTVLDYGLPELDWAGRGLVLETRPRLARVVRETIAAFEPRLANVRVEIRDAGEVTGEVLAVIEASLVMDEVREPISFALPLGGPGEDGG